MQSQIILVIFLSTTTINSFSQSIDCKALFSLADYAIKNEWILHDNSTKTKIITPSTFLIKCRRTYNLKKASFFVEKNTSQKLYINNIRVNQFEKRDESYFFKIETVLFGTVTSRDIIMSSKSPYTIINDSVNFFWNE